jgi:hypothetical protein
MRAALALLWVAAVAGLIGESPADAQSPPPAAEAPPPAAAVPAAAVPEPVADPAPTSAAVATPASAAPTGAPPPAQSAAPAVFDPTVHAHDGFFLRLQLGLASTTFDPGGTSGSSQSSGGVLNLAVGGAVTPNIILFGALFWNQADHVTVTSFGGQPIAPLDTNATLGGLGAGGAYCFMPSNACLSGMLAAANLTFNGKFPGGQTQMSTTNGVAVKADLTKEWWLSKQIAFGLGAELLVTGDMPDKAPDNVTWRAKSFALLASAIFN